MQTDQAVAKQHASAGQAEVWLALFSTDKKLTEAASVAPHATNTVY
jgi:hypothetical protein